MRAAVVGVFLVAAPGLAHAARVDGDVVVVEDAQGSAHTGFAGLALNVCTFATRGLYTLLGDDFDAVMVFTTHPLQGLQYTTAVTPVGYSVRQPDPGVAYGSVLTPRSPAEYGSAATLQHCVFMGPMRTLPPSPESEFALGLKAIEVLGHEFGHHWLLYAAFDKNDGAGPQALLRANLRDGAAGDPIASSTLHYSTLADSHSVMLGSFITPLGGGDFLLEGGARKYGPLDQYLMGLRRPQETPPMLVVDDGSHLGLYEQPLRPGESVMRSGTAVMVAVDDVVRAHGVRSPAYPNAQTCWRTAFILVTHQGHTATAQELAVVEGYRTRWETWFLWATDGRGQVNTQLDATTCAAAQLPLDAGVPPPDAATVTPPDSGAGDAFVPLPPPADAAVPDAATTDAGADGVIRGPGCDCQSTRQPVSPLVLVLLGAHGMVQRRTRRGR